MIAPIITGAFLAVSQPTTVPKPLPPRMHLKWHGTKPLLKIRVMPNAHD